MLNITTQSHSAKNGCFNQTKVCLIVPSFNPIPCRPPVHFHTNFKVLITYFIEKYTQRNHFLCSQLLNKNKPNNTLCYLSIEYIFLFIEIRHLIPPTIKTHIDCSMNSKSVFGLYDTSQSPSACPSPSDSLTTTTTHLTACLSSNTIQCTQDSSKSLAVMNGEQSHKSKKFCRGFTNYDLLLEALKSPF